MTALHRLDYKHHTYDKIGDPQTRMVAARCLEKERSKLMHGEYHDDEDGTIARRQKRHRREGWFMTTHLCQKKTRRVLPDSNGVELVNRRFAAVRSDGGGNRTQRGMDANSILFIIMATDWINGNSLVAPRFGLQPLMSSSIQFGLCILISSSAHLLRNAIDSVS